MAYDVNNAYRITERLAFPRLIGSEGEIRARQIVAEEFKKAGYEDVILEKFKTSFYNWIFIRFVFVLLGIFIMVIGFSFFFNHWITLALIAIFTLFFIKSLAVGNATEIKLFKNDQKNFETENIYTKLKSQEGKATVVFMGHWDSKSQTFPSSLRIILIILAVFGALI
ncbi:MAG: hypothetical protein EU539_09320, partial [Promethearchaeota archaeon]